MTIVKWVNPTKNTDGGAYDAATENKGYDLAFDGEDASVTLPFAFGTEFDYGTTQAYADLKSGTHQVKLRVINKDNVTSAWSSPAPFRKAGTPEAPVMVGVA